MKIRNLLKRGAMLLLAGALLLSACTAGTEPETSDTSEASSEAESGVSGDTRFTLVSVGKPYTSTLAANDHYPDMFGQQLTDGQKVPDIGSFYTDIRMVGYTGTSRFDIDLGEDGKRISAVSARTLDVNQDGVRVAASARFFGSNDGDNWTALGRSFFSLTGEKTVSTARLELKEIADYRYIRVTLSPSSGAAFYFVDEIEVFADVPEKQTVSTLEASYADEKIDRDAWKSLSTGKAATPVAIENAARGKKYSFINATPDPRAEESHDIAKLIPMNTQNTPFDEIMTDGARTGRLFGDRVWTGIKADKESSLKVDLGSKREDLFSFRLYMTNAGVDLSFPDYVDVYGSTDDKAYTLLGRMYAPAQNGNYTYTLILPEYVGTRYVRFDFPAGKGNYWMEEVEVYAGLSSVPEEEMYPVVNFPKVTEELRWDPSEPDYKTVQNLLLGRTQQVAVSYFMDVTRANNNPAETPWDTTLLTDGKRAPDSYCYSGGWFFHKGGGAIEFIYDMEKLSSVDSVNVSYLEQLDWGINHPNYISVMLSEDATNWYTVKTDHITNEASRTVSRVTREIKLDQSYAARFISIRVESAVLFIDELEVIGTKQVTNKTTRLSESGIESHVFYTNDEDRAFASMQNTPVKANDIAIVYGNKGTEADLLPLVAYLDADGNVVDTFMDGFLYCPTGSMPSGAAAHENSYKKDWDYMFDQIFNGGTGFDLLEKVVGDVKQQLNRPDYTVQVYITVICPSFKNSDFGDVDGDGVSEDLTTAEARRKVLDWYITTCQSEFAGRNYQNLELGGFYWISEAIAYYDDDSALVREIADAVHAHDSYFLWIPYYAAHRYYLGYDLGFDLICMQPNYAFNLEKTLSNFTATIRRMQAMGGCIEIENSYQSMSDPLYARNYMLYLYYGAMTGYMQDAIHIYYDDINNYSAMAYSDSALCRLQYDATYAFIRGTLQVTPEKLADVSFDGKKDAVLYGSIPGQDEFSFFTLTRAPEHGYVSLSEDGTFTYYPDKGYTGTDGFSYTYNRFLGESEPCTVSITLQ